MPTTITAEWQQIALYAVIAAVALILIQRIPVIGRLIRFALSFALLAFCLFLLIQQAPYQPFLSGIADKIGLDRQEVVGREVRLRMSSDGHFWANVTLNGVKRRMLVDSGATVTAISEATADAAGIDEDAGLVPVMMRTANGVVPARTGTIDELRLGNVVARDLKVVVSPGLGNLDVIGMNFLSKLVSWRVEGRTLILVPHHPQAQSPADK
ncbi:TIGR02281 family clan AA aspartic protease [Sphingosinicella sp. BN140058]|uniref:retropepsin-like aspartic protease family protein n=1 Tax=Sphingosinicella sp. BN140058 TaxID=1892855 RepID=UPI001012B067|nr:retropepsin-like aspartic protease [Sphingosinicella sp. BN140058]QAY75294.1 TIGR02281 family clan AA aspartic protease [Sphingosinicella sp. BN140058]